MMSQQEQITQKKFTPSKLCSKSFFLIFSLAYFCPHIFIFFVDDFFALKTGWDEPFYLTILGSCNQTLPGYWFSGSVICSLNRLGLPGSTVSLTSNILLFLACSYFVGELMRSFFGKGFGALFIGATILTSPILFNVGNPLVMNVFDTLGSHDFNLHFIGFGRESYQSFFRTPHPQYSLLLVFLAGYLYSRKKNLTWLFAPLPLLYFYVAAPYAIVTSIFFGEYFLRKRRVHRPMFLSCIVVAAVSFAGFYLLLLFGASDLKGAAPHHFYSHRMPRVPLASIFIMMLMACQYLFFGGRFQDVFFRGQMILLVSSLISANLHLATGVMIAPKNMLDYGISFLGGCSLAIFFMWVKKNSPKISEFLYVAPICLVIIILTCLSSGYRSDGYYHNFNYLRSYDPIIIKKVREAPLSAIFLNPDAGSQIAYAFSNSLNPPLSYQYNFIIDSCDDVRIWREKAVAFVRSQESSGMISEEQTKIILKYASLPKDKPSNEGYAARCFNGHELERNFFFVRPENGRSGWLKFSWKDMAAAAFGLSKA